MAKRSNERLFSGNLDLRVNMQNESGLKSCSNNGYNGSLTNEEWMTAKETADYLRISVGAIRNLTSNGKLPFYKLGNRVRYLRQEIRDYLLSQKRGLI